MRNACPSCQTVYAVTSADVGRRIVCKNCQATLVIDEDGFRQESPPPTASPAAPAKAKPPATDRPDRQDRKDDDEGDKPRRKPRDRTAKDDEDDEPARAGPGLTDWVRQNSDIPTIVFAAGTFFVLLFMFLPLIAKAGEGRATALLQQGELDHAAEVKKLREKPNTQEAIARADDTWEKRKEKLQAESQQAALSTALDAGFHRIGLLAGFVLTAFGGIGLLMSHQHLAKKIVGAVVVCAMLLVVFWSTLMKG